MTSTNNPVIPSSPGASPELYWTNIRTFQRNFKNVLAEYTPPKRYEAKKFSIKKNPPPFCGAFTTAFFKRDENGKIISVSLVRLRCNLWSCPICGPKKAIRIKYLIIEIAKLNNLDHFWTLTLDPKKVPEEYKNKTSYYLTYLFNRYITYLKQRLKISIPYIWVLEHQKNGNAHLHILVKGFLPVKLLRYRWEKMGGGKQMRIDPVDNVEYRAAYISNYLVKGIKDSTIEESRFFVKERRYCISHSCIRLQKLKTPAKKITSIRELNSLLTSQQIFRVYNAFKNTDISNKEIVLNHYQEKLNL